ncbi:B3 domain-containing protein REM19-like protein [Carex littledalei]|uniref:B3 domain-containing protein REM19-like protein n=1 Tax=Carex littledalei TaxID=544730 RepID=A0A833QP78_9POAL|nr:B3 domain-containing protein REM19-like protein [Carex littledalei]
MEGPAHNMYQDKVTFSGSSSDSEYSTDDSTPVRMPRGRASKEVGTSKDPNGGCIFKAPNIEQITFAHESSLTPEDKERAVQLSKGTQPGNSCFAILIKPSMIMGKFLRFVIPVKFVREHLPQQTKKGILHYKKCTWPLSITYDRIYASFAAGWKQFVQDNHVQAGDLCLFELIKSNKTFSFKVHISRK